MNIRPVGSRILVRPDLPPPVSDLIVAPDNATPEPEMSGTVVALGNGHEAAMNLKRDIMVDVRKIIQRVMDTIPNCNGPAFAMLLEEIGQYGASMPYEYDVKIGERVVFPWNVGTKMALENVEYIVLREDDPIAVFTEDEASEAA